MKFENIRSQKSGRSIVIDFQMINVHTGWYVKGGGTRRSPSNNRPGQHYESYSPGPAYAIQ
jgi:hypothetical protein